MLYQLKGEKYPTLEYRVISARACMAVPICPSMSQNLMQSEAIWSHPAAGVVIAASMELSCPDLKSLSGNIFIGVNV